MAFTQGHALIIGAGSHQSAPRYDVPMAAADARAVAETLLDSRFCGYPAGQVLLLENRMATRAGILVALEEIALRIRADDTFVFFFAGHGAEGTDGNYHIVTHDAEIEAGQVSPDTCVSELDLVKRLQGFRARRVLLVFNTEGITQHFCDGLLGTGQGRIIMSACQETQKSYPGRGPLAIFTQAFVDGLRGSGVSSSAGFLSAFNLYESVHGNVSKLVQEKYSVAQQPELTVLKGAGSFAVGLYRGAQDPGDPDMSAQPASALRTVRQVEPERAQRAVNIYNNVYAAAHGGGGAVVHHDDSAAAGETGVLSIGNSLRELFSETRREYVDAVSETYIGGAGGGDMEFVNREETDRKNWKRGKKPEKGSLESGKHAVSKGAGTARGTHAEGHALAFGLPDLSGQELDDILESLEKVAHGDEIGGDKVIEGDEVHGDKVAGDKVAGDKIIIYNTLPAGQDDRPVVEERIRLDVAAPPFATLNIPFDLAVAVRNPEAPLLVVEDLTQVKSQPGHVFFHEDEQTISYKIEVSALDCVVRPESNLLKLRPHTDSEPCWFQIEPSRPGKQSILVTAYQEDSAVAAQSRIIIEVQVPVGASGQNLAPVFAPLLRVVLTAPQDVQPLASRMVSSLMGEVDKGREGSDEGIAELIEDLVQKIPAAGKVLVEIFAAPLVSANTGPATKFVLKRIQKR